MSPSSIHYRGTWKLHKRSSEPDRWLDEMGFYRKHTARDASCLFRAVSENIYNTQRYFHKVRMDCVQFMDSKRHLFEGLLPCSFENYLREMMNPSEWGGMIEVTAMSHLYRHDIVIFEANKGPQTKICNGYGDTIYLFYSPDSKHFDAVYTKDFINTSSFCQSLVYEILYDKVYQLKDLPYAVDKMLHDKIQANHIEYFMTENVERRKKQKERAKIFIEATSNNEKDKTGNALTLKCKHHTEDTDRASLLKESLSIFVFNRSLIQLENVCMNCLNVNSAKDLLDNGIIPFPYKVAKALDPDIYRNIEFDSWSELRRELRYGARYSDGTTLQVGVKCLCKLRSDESATYRCHIQEMNPDGGPCVVFVEELGEKRVVDFKQLEPLPSDEVRPWAPPYRFSRSNSQFLNLSQMLQQLGNITRKQGLGKVRKGKGTEDVSKGPEKITTALNPKQSNLAWNDETMDEQLDLNSETCTNHNNVDLSAYQHLDYLNFEPMPIEIHALPLMVDIRPAEGIAPQEPPHNGAPPPAADNQGNRITGNGDAMATPPLNLSGPPAQRATTPGTSAMTVYSGMNGGGPGVVPAYNPAMLGAPGGLGCAPYGCAMKGGVVWCAPQPPPPPPPIPPTVNPNALKSVMPNGADLPLNDIATLRFYYNAGVDMYWAPYGVPPPRPYPQRDLAQEMQQMTLQERPPMNNHNGQDHGHKHKPLGQTMDKGGNHHSKVNGQRAMLGPRFKREGGQNNYHQNKGHNNGGGNKGPNNRRGSYAESRNNGLHAPPPHYGGVAGGPGAEPELAMEPQVMPVSYMYPPPTYPLHYYPIEAEPQMMGMMAGVQYVGYEDTGEYLPQYLPPPPAYPPPQAMHAMPPPQPPHAQSDHK